MPRLPRVNYESMSPAEREQKLLRGPKHPEPRATPNPKLASVIEADLRAMLAEIDESGEDLTEWEINFIARLIDSRAKRFTPAQAKQIRRIHQERVS